MAQLVLHAVTGPEQSRLSGLQANRRGMNHSYATTTESRPMHLVEQDGLIGIRKLVQFAKEHGATEFEAAFPAPGLVLGQYIAHRAAEPAPASKGGRFRTFKASSLDLLRYVDKVAFVAKRPGNTFPDIVFVGRGTTNDVILDVQSVSKLHGRFEEQDGTWYFTDTDASLGTWLNGQQLQPASRHALASSDQLRIGPDLVAQFVHPRELHRLVVARL